MPYETIANTTKTRWIPNNGKQVNNPFGVAYIYTTKLGGAAAVLYSGKSAKSTFHYLFADEQDAMNCIERHFNSIAESKKAKAIRHKESFKGHTLAVGDIVYYSWGYDQTNIDWFKIVKTTKNFVYIQELPCRVTDTGFMSGSSFPCVDAAPVGKIERHKANGNTVTMPYGWCGKWDGTAKSCSWGH